jgi:OPA family sugar phosphate sensor protein UhpC-like MFS transporter
VSNIFDFFKSVSAASVLGDSSTVDRLYRKYRYNIVFAITMGYGFYYTCRLGLSVVKKPLIDSGILTAEQLGQIGSVMFYGYALGKFVNGFLADYVNVRKMFTAGLLLSAVCNLIFGVSSLFWVFMAAWAVNGWLQGMGVGCCVVSLANWFSVSERGRYYGIWSTAHSIGEGMTFIFSSLFITIWGWRAGFLAPAIICLFVSMVLYYLMKDRPCSYGLPSIADWKNNRGEFAVIANERTFSAQMQIFKMPAMWIICFASAAMYITRYAVNSWGMLFLQEAKGFDVISAGGLLGLGTGFSIAGGLLYGFFSDKVFNGRRPPATLIFGILEITAMAVIFMTSIKNHYILAIAFALFGFSVGGLLVGLGGLLAIDIVSKKAAGAALGFIGVFSYVATAIQEYISGILIKQNSQMLNGIMIYDFTIPVKFWMAAAVVSLCLGLLAWKSKPS